VDPVQVVILVGMGAFVGLAGGYAGIGGAPFLVAALVLFLGFEQHTAQGTVLAVMLGPMSLAGVLVMWDRVRLLLPEIVLGVTTYALFSNLGARAAFAMDTQALEIGFGGLLILLGGRYLTQSRRATTEALIPDKVTIGQGTLAFSHWNVGVLSALIGVVGGLFGIGAGVLMVPLFMGLFALHKDDARALSLAILLPPVSVGAIVEYAHHDAIDWEVAGIMFILYFLTNHFGAKWGRAHETRTFLHVMGGILLFLGATLVWTATSGSAA